MKKRPPKPEPIYETVPCWTCNGVGTKQREIEPKLNHGKVFASCHHEVKITVGCECCPGLPRGHYVEYKDFDDGEEATFTAMICDDCLPDYKKFNGFKLLK